MEGAESKHIDLRNWNHVNIRWDVKGGQCQSGHEWIVVDSRWNVVTCGAPCGKHLGTFPNITPQIVGTCTADECPCVLAAIHGVNSRHNLSMADIFHSEKGKLKDFLGKDQRCHV